MPKKVAVLIKDKERQYEGLRSSLGLLLDREYGLLPWAPVYLLLPAAWAIDRRASWPLLVPAVLLFLPCAAHDLPG